MKITSRRTLLRRLTSLGLWSSATLPFQAMAAVAQPLPNDYKAIVCIFLNGGNDHFNTLIPYDTQNYNLLSQARPGLVPERASLTPLSPITSQNGRQVAFHPRLSDLKRLFDQRKLAVVHGIAPMLQPASRADLYAGRVALPPSAGSHNDGASMFHTLGLEGSRYGWGGRMLDLLLGSPTPSTFASIAAGFTNSFGSGQLHSQISVDIRGVANNFAGVDALQFFGSSSAPRELRNIQTSPSSNLLDQAYQDVVSRVFRSSTACQSAFANSMQVPAFTGPDIIAGRDNTLGPALQTVVRLIQQRHLFQAQRQVFFLELGGFDTHGGMVIDHANQLHRVNHAMRYFQDTLDQLGLGDLVLTFTSTEFGRALTSNGDGTDHGWGGVAFAMGNAVAGGDIYGTLPDMNQGSNDFQALGGPPNSIPRFSVEQFGATVARWFGVSDTNMNLLFPLLPRFSPRYLPFLRA